MNTENRYEYNQVRDLLGQEKADQLFQSLEQMRPLFDDAGEQPGDQCMAKIMAQVKTARPPKQTGTWSQLIKVASVAAAFFIAALLAVHVFQQDKPGQPEPIIYDSSRMSDSSFVVDFRAQLDEIEMLLEGYDMPGSYGYENVQLLEIEDDFILLTDSFWKG